MHFLLWAIFWPENLQSKPGICIVQWRWKMFEWAWVGMDGVHIKPGLKLNQPGGKYKHAVKPFCQAWVKCLLKSYLTAFLIHHVSRKVQYSAWHIYSDHLKIMMKKLMMNRVHSYTYTVITVAVCIAVQLNALCNTHCNAKIKHFIPKFYSRAGLQ